MEVNQQIEYERISLYVPKTLSRLIDLKRGDIPKSKYIQRILEKHFDIKEYLN